MMTVLVSKLMKQKKKINNSKFISDAKLSCVCVRRCVRALECFFGHEVLKSEGIKSDKMNTRSRTVSLNFFGFLADHKKNL